MWQTTIKTIHLKTLKFQNNLKWVLDVNLFFDIILLLSCDTQFEDDELKKLLQTWNENQN